MKIIRCLLIASQALVFVACAKKENLPERKIGDVCNIEWDLENVGVLGGAPSTAPMDEDFSFSLSIPYYSNRFTDWKEGKEPKKEEFGELKDKNVEYEIKLQNIKVLIGGKEYKDSYDFYYLDNRTNKFTIKSKYMVNDIRILISATERAQILSQYALVFSKSLHERIIYTGHDPESTIHASGDSNAPDIKVEFESKYQSTRYPIKLFNHGTVVAFPIIEHDEVEIEFEATGDKTLPTDIQLRTGAHFGVLDVDYSIQYIKPSPEEKGSMKCIFKIPKYIVRDHIVISINGEVD